MNETETYWEAVMIGGSLEPHLEIEELGEDTISDSLKELLK